MIIFCLLAAVSPLSHAYQWMKNITQLEYLASSPMCKRAIAIWNDNHGGLLGWAPRITREESLLPANWNSGDKAIWRNGGWHYCGGAIRIRRGEAMFSPVGRVRHIEDGIGNAKYTLKTLEPTDPWYPEIGTTIARGYNSLEQEKEAFDYLEGVLKYHPDYEPAHTLYGIIHYQRENYAEARAHFRNASEVSDGQSAQAVYFLGLTYLKTNDLEEAKKYAAEAERLGYPLPGLKNLIAAAENNTDDNDAFKQQQP